MRVGAESRSVFLVLGIRCHFKLETGARGDGKVIRPVSEFELFINTFY